MFTPKPHTLHKAQMRFSLPRSSLSGYSLVPIFPGQKPHGAYVLEEIIPKSERVSRELVLEQLKPPLELSEVFGNDNPVELEIGIGKGYFLQCAAVANPDHNFIGIEIRRKYLKVARDRAEKRPIPNVRYVNGEAFMFMEEFLKPETLHTLHIYFPDPWPKKRHHKRRLFSPEFLKLAYERLIPGGLLLIATDHAGYWEQISEVLANQTLLDHCDDLPAPPPGAHSLTNYEKKYIEEGRTIYRTGYRKPQS